jgi:hypothetical protein
VQHVGVLCSAAGFSLTPCNPCVNACPAVLCVNTCPAGRVGRERDAWTGLLHRHRGPPVERAVLQRQWSWADMPAVSGSSSSRCSSRMVGLAAGWRQVGGRCMQSAVCAGYKVAWAHLGQVHHTCNNRHCSCGIARLQYMYMVARPDERHSINCHCIRCTSRTVPNRRQGMTSQTLVSQ